jgi:hypothetical protein
MSISSHKLDQSCRCSMHARIEAQRHDCYRQLAHAILGPAAPQEDSELARALAEHALLLRPAANITAIRRPRAA